MEKRVRMWVKTVLIITGLLFFCFIVGRREPGTDYEKEARIRQYETDESVAKLHTVLLAYGEAIRWTDSGQATVSEPGTEDGQATVSEPGTEDGQATVVGQEAAGGSSSDEILTTDGIYTYQMEDVDALLYKRVTAYIKDGCILEAEEETKQEETLLANVWVMEEEGERILCFLSGTSFYLPYQARKDEEDGREQVADIILLDGEIKECRVKKEKISGKLLAVTEDGVTLEEKQSTSEDGDILEEKQSASEDGNILGEKRYVLDENVRVYRLYGALEEMSLQELPIGYENTDYVLDEGKVCACLVTSEENMETIRVLLQSGNYGGRFHESVTFSADCDYMLQCGEEKQKFAAGAQISITPDCEYFDNQDRIILTTTVNTGKITLESIQRNRERTDYRGSMEILRTEEGLAVINELLLEEYLYGVVPSEMPASYPRESLKAQAVCARTYAYRNMEKAGLPELGAHVDDSTAYQVYGNTEERAETTAAVKATKGQLLTYDGEPIDAYYYSTSCGYGTDIRAWNGPEAETVPYLTAKSILIEAVNADILDSQEQKTEINASAGFPSPEELTDESAFQRLIEETPEQFLESKEAWYRWRYTVDEVDVEEMERRLLDRYEAQPQYVLTKKDDDYISQQPEKIGKLEELSVMRRNTGGSAAELLIKGSLGAYLVRTEYNIRYVLLNGGYPVIRQDGEETIVSSILPSAFLTVKTGKEHGNVVGYSVVGGGYGHGIGMSQNGAKNMALEGLTAKEILAFFYEGCRLETVY